MLDTRIYTFLKVCELKSYTAAAAELNLTQPAVSQHIAYLEEFYGHKLIHYERRKLTLTPEGEYLYQKAKSIYADCSLIKRRMDELEAGRISCNFGATMTVGEFVIAKPLAKYAKRHPEIDIRMDITNTSILEKKLRSGELSFAIVEGNYDRQEFDSELFAKVPFVAVASSKHKFHKEPKVFADLMGETVLLREEGSGTRNILELYLKANNYDLDMFTGKIQIGGMHTLLRMMSEDTGISFMYQTAVKHMLSHGKLKLIELSDFQIMHDFCMIWPKGSSFSEEYRALCHELKELSENI